MSARFQVFVGVYVKCTCEMKTVRRQFKSCPNEPCANNGLLNYSDSYCPNCGCKIKSIRKTSQVPSVDPGDLIIDELRWMMGVGDELTHYFSSNMTDDKSSREYDRYSANAITKINPEDIEKEVICFRERYKEDLDILEEAYGEENVEISWGIIVYFS